MFSRPARAARVDLRRVSTLDLERVARTVDIDALEAQLDAVLSSKLSEGELRRLGGAGSTQLFRLMQMLVEYLLHVQQTLYSRGMELEHAAQVTSSQLLEQDSLRIKTGRPLRSSTFHSSPHKQAHYAGALEARLKGAAPVPFPGSHAVEEPPPGASGPAQCHICFKLFSSADYLAAHYRRRHEAHFGQMAQPEPEAAAGEVCAAAHGAGAASPRLAERLSAELAAAMAPAGGGCAAGGFVAVAAPPVVVPPLEAHAAGTSAAAAPAPGPGPAPALPGSSGGLVSDPAAAAAAEVRPSTPPQLRPVSL